MINWKLMAELPEDHRDGRQLLCTDGAVVRVCWPKRFKPEIWEYHRDERWCPGHTWSMIPTHWAEINLPADPAMIVVEGAGFRLLTADSIMIAVVRRCAELAAQVEELKVAAYGK